MSAQIAEQEKVRDFDSLKPAEQKRAWRLLLDMYATSCRTIGLTITMSAYEALDGEVLDRSLQTLIEVKEALVSIQAVANSRQWRLIMRLALPALPAPEPIAPYMVNSLSESFLSLFRILDQVIEDINTRQTFSLACYALCGLRGFELHPVSSPALSRADAVLQEASGIQPNRKANLLAQRGTARESALPESQWESFGKHGHVQVKKGGTKSERTKASRRKK